MKISIIGAAGSVGSPAAFYLVAKGLADEIVMIGGRKQTLGGFAQLSRNSIG